MRAEKLNSVMNDLDKLIDRAVESNWTFGDLFAKVKIQLEKEDVDYTLGTQLYLIRESINRA